MMRRTNQPTAIARQQAAFWTTIIIVSTKINLQPPQCGVAPIFLLSDFLKDLFHTEDD
jgi:hypothetical protein